MVAITLITDFGLRDGHVGAMKGVIHSIAPQADLYDLSHNIPPQDIRHGGFVLMSAYLFWPNDTIHLIVIDPGVGTDRRAVAVRSTRGIFVAPDNGVLSYVLANEPATAAVSLTNPAYWHQPVSPVFHGRDIFGPAAAYLATGVQLEALGEVIDPGSLVTLVVPTPVRHDDGHITAHVQHIDSFGNCTTDLPGDWVRAHSYWQVQVAEQHIEQIDTIFADVPDGELVALIDSTGFLAIAVRNGHASHEFDLHVGSPVSLYPKSLPQSQTDIPIHGSRMPARKL